MKSTALGREKLQRIREYLGKAFEGYTIREDLSPVAVVFTLNGHDGEFRLEVDQSFLEMDVASKLDEWDVRGELCRAEGLPMILTREGVRLVSGN